jgi:hypothetical protein
MMDAFIVDGQHRLAAFAYADNLIDDFELPITVFLDLKLPMQAELFSRINGTQQPVKKSLLYDLTEFEKDEYGSIKRCHSIAKLFNNDSDSPFYRRISMLGNKLGLLSQAAFIDELVRYVKHRKANNHKSFLQYKSAEEIADILDTYFSAIKNVYEKEWYDTDNYVLLRTTGFGALMKFLYYMYIYFECNGMEFIDDKVRKFLEKMPLITDFSIKSIGKVGSQGIQKQLCDQIVNKLIGDIDKLKDLEKRYKDIWLLKYDKNKNKIEQES